jgi:hypothetical protein
VVKEIRYGFLADVTACGIVSKKVYAKVCDVISEVQWEGSLKTIR